MQAAILNPFKVAVAGLVILTPWVQAQENTATSPQIEARRNFEFASEDLMLPTFAPESEADRDLGIQLVMQPQEDYEPFRINAFTGYSYTTNAGLADENPDEDNIFYSTASASFLPILRRNLYGEMTVRGSMFRYDDRSDLDFETIQAGAGLISVFRNLADLSGFLRYNYTEYAGIDPIIADSYSDHDLEFGLFKSHLVSRNQFIYASYMSEISLDGDPDFARRDEHSLTLGYRVTPVRKWKAEVFFRAAYLDFEENSREDWNETVGGSLTYNFTKNIYLSGFVSYTDNQSNLDNAGYEVWSPGIRFGGNWRF